MFALLPAVSRCFTILNCGGLRIFGAGLAIMLLLFLAKPESDGVALVGLPLSVCKPVIELALEDLESSLKVDESCLVNLVGVIDFAGFGPAPFLIYDGAPVLAAGRREERPFEAAL